MTCSLARVAGISIRLRILKVHIQLDCCLCANGVAGISIRLRILKAILCSRGSDASEQVAGISIRLRILKECHPDSVARSPGVVAGISIRLRILKVGFKSGRCTTLMGCRDIDPVEDTESLPVPHQADRHHWLQGYRSG